MKFVKASLLDNSPTLSVVGGSLIFVISSFSNVENFYIQLATDETIEKLNNFDFLMTTECIIDIISFDALRIGDLVVFADLQTWGQKRAAVTAICRLKCLCSIFLIDYGITVENVRPEKLKFYPGILMDAPMALKAAFCGLKSVVNSNGVISSFVENEILEGVVEYVESEKLFLKVFLDSCDEETLNDMLIANGLACAVSNKSEYNDFGEHHSKSAAEVFTGSKKIMCDHFEKFGTCKYGNSCKFVHDSKSLAKAEVNTNFIGTDGTARELPEHTFNVLVMHCETPAVFYLKQEDSSLLASERDQLETFQSYYSTNCNSSTVSMVHEGTPCYPAVGEMIAAFDTVCKQWKRARVMKFREINSSNKSFEVFAVDFGATFKCGMSDIRKLLRPYLFQPYIFHARLKVEPKKNESGCSNGWSPEAKKETLALLEKARSVMCAVDFRNDDLYVVDLFTRNPGNRLDKFLIDNHFAEECAIPALCANATVIPG